MPRLCTLVALVLFASLAGALRADDWPQWRGPNRDGVSKESGLLQEWPEGGPKLLWQVKDLGDGFSTPAVVGTRLYVLANNGMTDEYVRAVETGGGKTLWTTRIGEVGPNRMANYPGARSTPTVDGDRLYALGSNGDLACLESQTGKIVWQKNVRTDFQGQTGAWAYAESPLVDGDVVVCTPGGPEATLLALDKKSGEVVWKAPLKEADNAAYASIIIVEAAGVKQYVQLLENGLVGIEAKTGTPLWRYKGIITAPPGIPTPLARKDLVFGATVKGGAGLVKLKSSGTGVEAAEVYLNRRLPTAIGGSVEVNGYLYGTTGGSLICAEFSTGEIKWQEGEIKAGSLLYADGRLYWHGEAAGDVALVEATAEAYREKGKFMPPDVPKGYRGKSWAYPVVANGRLYIRDWNCMWCYDIKAK